MNTEQLREVLARGAAPVPRPDFARAALEEAAGVRRRRAGATATVAAAVMVVALTVGLSLSDGPRTQDPAAPPSSPTSGASSADATAPPIPESVVQSRWDPREVTTLPTVDIGLPSSLTPPADVKPLTGIGRALALVDDQQSLFLVDDTGAWSRLDYPEPPLDRYGRAAVLTVDGSQVVFTGRSALWSRDVSGGDWQRLDYPAGFTTEADWGGAQLVPDSGDGLWLGDPRHRRAWYVDLATGVGEELDVALDIAAAAGERGLVRIGVVRSAPVRFLAIGEPGASEETWRTDALQSLTAPAADSDSVAAVRGVGTRFGDDDPTEQNGLIALRLDDLATRAYLPVPDPNYWYTDAGGLSAVSWLDADTVLASVVPQGLEGDGTETRYLFTWDVESGDVRLASQIPATSEVSLASEGLGQVP